MYKEAVFCWLSASATLRMPIVAGMLRPRRGRAFSPRRGLSNLADASCLGRLPCPSTVQLIVPPARNLLARFHYNGNRTFYQSIAAGFSRAVGEYCKRMKRKTKERSSHAAKTHRRQFPVPRGRGGDKARARRKLIAPAALLPPRLVGAPPADPEPRRHPRQHPPGRHRARYVPHRSRHREEASRRRQRALDARRQEPRPDRGREWRGNFAALGQGQKGVR